MLWLHLFLIATEVKMFESLDNKAAIKEIILRCVGKIENLYNGAEKPDVYRNVIDPFSAIYDGGILGLSRDEWLIKEVSRQTHNKGDVAQLVRALACHARVRGLEFRHSPLSSSFTVFY